MRDDGVWNFSSANDMGSMLPRSVLGSGGERAARNSELSWAALVLSDGVGHCRCRSRVDMAVDVRRWLHRASVPLVMVVATAAGVWASRQLSPSVSELRILADADSLHGIVRAIASVCPSELGGNHRAAYDELRTLTPTHALLRAWSTLSLWRWPLMDRLSAARMVPLLLGTVATGALYSVVRRAARAPAAWLSIALLWSIPAWSHGVGTSDDGVLVSAAWLSVFALYLGSSEHTLRRHRLLGGIAPAVVFAIFLSLTLRTCWVLPLIVAHSLLQRPGEVLASLRSAQLRAPALLLYVLGVSPVVFVALSPQTWSGGAIHHARAFLAKLGPEIEASRYHGSLITELPVPRLALGERWLIELPPVVVVLSVVGAGFLALGAFRGDRSARSLLAFCFVGVSFLFVWSAISPEVFTVYPGSALTAFPFIAAAAGVGAWSLGRTRRQRQAVVVLALALCVSSLVTVQNASGYGSWIAGGTDAKHERFSVSDSSELAGAFRELSSGDAVVFAPDVPASYWDWMARSGRFSTVVSGTHRQATHSLLRGDVNGASYRIRRGRHTLWSVVPTGADR